MASKEPPENIGTFMTVFFAQLCYVIYVLFYFFGENFFYWLTAMIVLGIIVSLFSVILSVMDMNAEEAYEEYYDTEILDDNEDEIL